MKFFYLLILLASVWSCQLDNDASFYKAKKAATSPPVTTFVSQGNNYANVLLTLQTDSTYQLRASFAPQESSTRPPLDLQGKWAVSKNHYQLYFPDTLQQINDLFAPIPGDASLVIYPDHSVAMDTALRQFYILGVIVERQ